ncbi:cupin domain-containing protein [Robiginitalea sp. M366]|uniref:cupin domain-containing protein n=1 Tax=Robiginitalea aestuariiviva TaxID=3036903 RepID=UPI00240E1E3C|nr:cupin domain-containing protein [Robiginitalea aestuariiviva]MDG1570974.1 cupin domain-containing protein [Robiginitalea aestuariiviva]
MNRKTFLQAATLGAGCTFLPSMGFARNLKSGLTSLLNPDPKLVRDQEGQVLNVIGDIQTHKLAGSDTYNQLVEWVDNVDPGVGIPPHVHTREDEVFRVIWGEVEITIDGVTHLLKAGDTAFAPKDVPHSWKVVGTEKARMITSAFPAGIEHMFAELAALPPGPPNFEKVAEICARQGIRFV